MALMELVTWISVGQFFVKYASTKVFNLRDRFDE